MRGKYKPEDTEYFRKLVEGTTIPERKKLLTVQFDTLWEEMWGPSQEGSHAYRHERETARAKLEQLRAASPSLQDIFDSVPAKWETPEWGYPKGRKEPNESEFACAMREMWEETNVAEKDVHVIRGLEPMEESFIGSNQVQYSHKYYIAYVPPDATTTTFEEAYDANEHVRREIGDIRWMGFEEAMAALRPDSVEKRAILSRIHGQLLRNYVPIGFRCGPVNQTVRQPN